MEGFIHIYNKERSLKLNNEIIKNTIDNYKNTAHTFSIIKNERLTGVYYTNEYEKYPYAENDKVLFCPVGQFTNDKNDLQSEIFNSTYSNINEVIRHLAGAFAISTVNVETDIIDIYTHVVRAESIFIYEDQNKIITGTDPLIVSIFSSESLKPVFDASNFISFFEQGYFADENTPYFNIHSLPVNSHVQIENNNINLFDIDDTYKNAFQEQPTEELFKEITSSFLNSFDIVKDNSLTIRSGLTGGKDSRLVLLALLNKDFNIKTHTTGFRDHPDVIIAKELAELLNVSHTINPRSLKEDNSIGVNVQKRIEDITTASSGLITAYDSVNVQTDFKDIKNFNGVAASVITGGFNRFSHNVKENNLAESLKKPLYKFSEYYNYHDNKYSKFLEEFATNHDDLGTLLHLFFLQYRTGRWTSDSRLAKSYSSNSYSVFLDNQLTKSAMKLNITDLRKEILHYKLIQKLNPSIINIPFYNHRFAFEKNGPSHPNDYYNWLLREPVYSKSKIGSYNWKSLGNNDIDLINTFKDVILSNKNNIVFDVVNYDSIEVLLNNKLTNRTNKFLWSIASQIYYTDFMKGKDIPSIERIEIKTPSDKIIEEKTPSKIIDMTEQLQSLNKSIDFDKNHQISFTDGEGNSYLKTYDGGFSEVPKSLELNGVKEIRCHANFFLHNIEAPRFTIIFYTKEKRFKTIILKEIHSENNVVEFNETIKLPKGAQYFRIAILFKDKNESQHKLNYLYLELKY